MRRGTNGLCSTKDPGMTWGILSIMKEDQPGSSERNGMAGTIPLTRIIMIGFYVFHINMVFGRCSVAWTGGSGMFFLEESGG
eukprot:10736772-Ditylum_brightwellii.AAC.1